MNLLRRLRNIYRLSAYEVPVLAALLTNENGQPVKLIKTIPTIKKKLATIIKEQPNYFEDAETTE